MVKRVGIPDCFVEQGGMERLRVMYGLDEDGLYKTALAFAKEPFLIS
jgi:transketolase C-terminal domain/subunit